MEAFDYSLSGNESFVQQSREYATPSNVDEAYLLLPLTSISIKYGAMFKETLRGFEDLVVGDGFSLKAASVAVSWSLMNESNGTTIAANENVEVGSRSFVIGNTASLILMSEVGVMRECKFILSGELHQKAFLLLPAGIKYTDTFELISKGCLS